MSRRLRRVNEAVREVVSSSVETLLKDPRVGFVTVTGVDTTPDLRLARVYVSVLGDEAERQATMTALEAGHGVLQTALAERLRLKRTPRLEFHYDDTLDRALRIQEVMAREEKDIAEREGGTA